ncbi:hypothetical protein [Maridesulfovibrio salexigens]|uniref:Uncharacterized protein n=1 Tax=Maridesulfovibrio salexigens (strain ATCC 14822 / DSM 2638 / NCIMB 8403 / VKM B-1763) TaxID=526222 RepID=C6BTY2_MARSD|nr:hypothetical protein [Maridesulfovibrio salexigens]ACS81691.1 hypothetical protein Desal_3645 [Maridesulfovibrio salexigens DSM 2638]
MKKLIGIFTVLLVFCASSAFALTAEYPAYYNGTIAGYAAGTDTANATQLFLTGFGVNASGTVAAATSKTQGRMNMFRSEIVTAASKSDLFLINATLGATYGGYLNGTIVYTNGTAAAETVTRSLADTAYDNTRAGENIGNYLTYDVTAGSTNQIGGLVTLGRGNGTLNATTYFVPAAGYQLMVGITNATSNMTGTADVGADTKEESQEGSGISMSMLYQNGTFKDIADGATWDYYAYGVVKNDPVVVFGQVQINSAYDSTSTTGNAQARYFLVNSTDTVDKSDWAYYNATTYKAAAGGNVALERDDTDYITLFENSTINVDKNMVTGFVRTAGKQLFAVMVKNGSDLSNSYLMNKGFTAVTTGSGRAGQEKGNATAGLMQFRVDGNMELTGSAHDWFVDSAIGSLQNIDRDETDLDQYTVDVTSTSQFKIAQTNATFKDVNGNVIGHFYGKRSSDDVFSVGIYESYVNKDFRDTSIAYRSLAFLIPTAATTTVITGAAANYQTNASMTTTSGTNYSRNSTGYTKTELLANWTGIASDFVPLTDVKGYTLTSSGKMGPGKDFYYTAKFVMTGVAGRVSDLALYKVMIDGSSAHLLTYAENEATTTDGAWWISRADGSGYLGPNSVLDATDEVVVNWVVKDNGSYDTNNTIDGGIVDPVVLGIAGSSSSSSGCVFNPAAGFGLEWLLLMLAPMVAIVRSRFK